MRRIARNWVTKIVRIVLRTGPARPGAPEQKVIVDFDINDYKDKTELMAQTLHHSDFLLRAFEACAPSMPTGVAWPRFWKGQQPVPVESLRELASGVLTQIGAILDWSPRRAVCHAWQWRVRPKPSRGGCDHGRTRSCRNT